MRKRLDNADRWKNPRILFLQGAKKVEERAGEICDIEMGGMGDKEGREERVEGNSDDVRGSVPEFGWQLGLW
jgi:hypothetical protein